VEQLVVLLPQTTSALDTRLSSSASGLSAGAIAGIAIGALCVIIVLVVGGAFYVRSRRSGGDCEVRVRCLVAHFVERVCVRVDKTAVVAGCQLWLPAERYTCVINLHALLRVICVVCT
jgi:hypothetical protein